MEQLVALVNTCCLSWFLFHKGGSFVVCLVAKSLTHTHTHTHTRTYTHTHTSLPGLPWQQSNFSFVESILIYFLISLRLSLSLSLSLSRCLALPLTPTSCFNSQFFGAAVTRRQAVQQDRRHRGQSLFFFYRL